jgi:hypothetical protein
MKRLLPFVLSLVSAITLNAQNTASDFDLTDCNGVQHQLFEELDNGYVILLQIVDPKSATNLSATRSIENLILQYKSAYPDKVYSYTMGVDDGNTCNDMSASFSSGLNHSQFAGSRAQADYFNATSLPAVIVMGNSSHNVYYNHSGYSSSQDEMIRGAIEEALADGSESGSSAVIKNSYASVFPNPFSSSLNVRLNESSTVSKVSICDLTGKSLLMKESTSSTFIRGIK